MGRPHVGVNFSRDVVDAQPTERLALIELARDGGRREWSFGEVARSSALFAGRLLQEGVRTGDVVLILIGNRPEWVISMLACFRIGAVALPCSEQLRAADLAARMAVVNPTLVIADARNMDEVQSAGPACAVIAVPDYRRHQEGPMPPAVGMAPDDPALIAFTSGSTGAPKAVVHAHRYLAGQQLQAQHWLGVNPGEILWCTAASGWSKSARNAFIAPWLRGATALLHDARFDPAERLELIARERVNVLCMAPTEYRTIANRAEVRPIPALRSLLAAGEPLNPEVLASWRELSGLEIRDGYGQTETGQVTGVRPGETPRPGSMGRVLPGVKAWIDDDELALDPATVPTFCLGYLGGDGRPADAWRTGDRVSIDSDGYLYYQGRVDDVIISAGYRIGPVEVESVLLTHPAVAEVAVVSAPDEERGAVVRAVIVPAEGSQPSDLLARELQEHVRRTTAPYKYPRIVDWADSLPKTSSGKLDRAALRDAT